MTQGARVEEFLEHILEALNRATSHTQNIADFETFKRSDLVQDAVLRNIMIIGEAANRIQRAVPDFFTAHPEVAWAQIRGMRNLVIHEYSYVDLEIVWDTVKDAMPAMKLQIDGLLVLYRQEPDEQQQDDSPKQSL